ncbi:hypothetical protein [Candidatus Contendibacter odensensis]|uniref:Uncharacterized protein n=1 Tax=Candidatus Contendobacter odensis Run_B_J11 TaxID=1400861 RepID=A0A7U7J5B0_9GAMM|nr:hypothetical protein [Candidatus Contendobacter odensis]CDH46567.1 hypothetical protein BN874_520008 [Candidatus Contendobacter odensis Run_B_J11]
MSQFDLKPCEFEKWSCVELWPVSQAFFILLGKEPPPLSYLLQDDGSPVDYDFGDAKYSWDSLDGWLTLNQQIEYAVDTKAIPSKYFIIDSFRVTGIKPSDLLAWAKQKEISIPAELEFLIPIPAKSKPLIPVPAKSKPLIPEQPELSTPAKKPPPACWLSYAEAKAKLNASDTDMFKWTAWPEDKTGKSKLYVYKKNEYEAEMETGYNWKRVGRLRDKSRNDWWISIQFCNFHAANVERFQPDPDDHYWNYEEVIAQLRHSLPDTSERDLVALLTEASKGDKGEFTLQLIVNSPTLTDHIFRQSEVIKLAAHCSCPEQATPAPAVPTLLEPTAFAVPALAPSEPTKKTKKGAGATRRTALGKAEDVALRTLRKELKREPDFAEFWDYLIHRDDTGTVADSTDDRLDWIGANKPCSTDKSTMRNRLTNVKKRNPFNL